MALFDLARSIFLSLRDDPDAIAAVRTAATALATAIATDGGASGRITSANVNGQSFAMADALAPADRLRVLRLVLSMAESDMVPSKTVQPYFSP